MANYTDDPYTLKEENGDWILEHDTNGVVKRYDESTDKIEFLKAVLIADLEDSTSGNLVYDSSAEQIGDGNQDADLNSLVSSLQIVDLVDANSGNLVYNESTQTVGDGNQSANLAEISLGVNYTLDEDSNGDLIIVDGDGTTVLRHDDSADQWIATDPFDTLEILSTFTDPAGVSHTGELADLTDIVDDHGNLTGLGDDDHTQYLLVDGTRAMSGALDMGSNSINNITALDNQDYNESVNTIADASGTTDIDLSTANWHEIEADGDITITFSNVTGTPPGNSLLLYFEDDDGTGPHTISWPASVVWSDGTVRDTIEADSDLEISLRSPDGGTTWRATRSGVNFS